MLIWILFLLLILGLLALDLGLFHKKAHKPSAREALGWTTAWIALAMLFSIFVYTAYSQGWVSNINHLSGREAVIKYITGYLVEKSLSVDNIFVISVIFTYFRIPSQYQHRVLFWGIVGALVFRGVLIGAGALLIHRFSWITYVFGAILLYSAWRMLKSEAREFDLARNPTINLVRRFLPVSTQLHGQRFFIRRMNITAATPLFFALIAIESSDIVFAFDSIPAIFAITTDPFLVFTSNIFAILGLRSLYFLLASALDKFHYLKPALVFIMFFVGVKILISHYFVIPEWISLSIVALALTAGIVASFLRSESPATDEQS